MAENANFELLAGLVLLAIGAYAINYRRFSVPFLASSRITLTGSRAVGFGVVVAVNAALNLICWLYVVVTNDLKPVRSGYLGGILFLSLCFIFISFVGAAIVQSVQELLQGPEALVEKKKNDQFALPEYETASQKRKHDELPHEIGTAHLGDDGEMVFDDETERSGISK